MCLDYTNTNSVYTYDECKWNQSKLPKKKANNFKWKLRGKKTWSFMFSVLREKKLSFDFKKTKKKKERKYPQYITPGHIIRWLLNYWFI